MSTTDLVYCEGSIVRIKLENFLTYDAVEFKPGPYLNVIIGPNATGKSSVVCAICLGLGGKTAFLGRAKDPSEYIKHGQQRAFVEIELHNPEGENWIVSRNINRDNSSKWSINRKNSTLKQVEELTTRLNIQIGNLCQFLPQEKVSDFAKMSPQELLENTEKAAGDPEMYELHQRLKSAAQSGRDLDQEFARKKELLEREIELNARLEQEVKNYQQRQVHLAKIDMLEKKKPWVEYEEKRLQYTTDKDKMEKNKELIKKARDDVAPMKAKLSKAQNGKKKADDAFKEQTELCKIEARHAANKNREIDVQTDEVESLENELEQARNHELRRQNKLKELRSQLEVLEQELDSIEDFDVQPQIESNANEMRKLNREMSSVQERIGTANEEVRQGRRNITRLQAELAQLQDVNNQRLETVRQRHRDTYDAVLWLRQNSHLFQGKIHEPIMTLINVTNPRLSKYIEMSVSFNDMRAFVCENPADIQPFLEKVRDQQKLAVNAVEMPSQPAHQFMPPKDIGHYKRFGFHGYLREMITCPEPVLRYLCRMHRFHCIPVGNDHTKNNVEAVIQACPELTTFYTANHQYGIRKSKYGGHMSSRCSEVRPPNLLTIAFDTQREEQVTAELRQTQDTLTKVDNEMKACNARGRELEKRLNELREEKKNLQERRNQRRTLQNRIDMKKQTISRTEDEAVDIDKEGKRINTKISHTVRKKCKLLQDQMEHTEKCLHASMAKVRASIQQAILQEQCTIIEEDMREQNVALGNLEQEFEELHVRVKAVKEEARRLLRAAKNATETANSEELSAELKKSFEALPKTLEEIEAAIHMERARMDCTVAADEGAVQDYERRKRTIAKLKDEVESCEARRGRHQGEVDTARKRWLEPLQNLIRRINDNFSYFFQQLRCAGEVELYVPEAEDDYAKYGVSIKVKFRASEQLQELRASYQSGGEKSVSTVLYMMALQELTSCPFRCVDEINQGMDPHNERRIFDTVKAACRKGTSQYFMLTPKLLPNLRYSSKMTVLCVFNGPHMVDWNLKRFIKYRSRLEG